MKTELDRLFTAAERVPEVLEANATAMDDFGTKAHNTLITIDELYVKSQGNGADAREARDVMQTATTEYLSSAKAMDEPRSYDGLREEAPGTENVWADDQTPNQPPSDPSPRDESTLVSPAADEPTRRQYTKPGDAPDSSPQLQGPAPIQAPAPTDGPPVAPNPNGIVRPVIGTAPRLIPSIAGRPVPMGPNGLTPPVIGPVRGYGYVAMYPGMGHRTGRSGARNLNRQTSAGPKSTVISDFLSSGVRDARPAMRPGQEGRTPAAAKSPGRRVKRTPRQGGAAVEGAIRRGTNTNWSRQQQRRGVFAAIDATESRKDKADEAASRPADPESPWDVRQVTVPAVIVSRKEN